VLLAAVVLIGRFVPYFVAQDRLASGNRSVGHDFRNGGRIGVVVADAQWHESAFAGAVAVHLCYFLFFADYAAAAEAEKMADHAGRVEKWGQDRYQRRPARNDHQSQGRCAGFARAARQFEARNQPRIGSIGDHFGGREIIFGRWSLAYGRSEIALDFDGFVTTNDLRRLTGFHE